ncbi:uncharacterized protein BDZ99DRAFT_477196 [Mytilinidion resinicola]|uniref:Uncharacterized protein n=1 Tax=Mytilinidion resinicola TaxID=574789 RepID=A0A6A6YMR2_9PEZI|nr:uncharacterized protein BDZ99DRAFT_477196 [Mytilinidion resinicola]KAF2809838.1 hypothetical protein BDZ99DRAFT_477196 [Mytilinidion resinicola]
MRSRTAGDTSFRVPACARSWLALSTLRAGVLLRRSPTKARSSGPPAALPWLISTEASFYINPTSTMSTIFSFGWPPGYAEDNRDSFEYCIQHRVVVSIVNLSDYLGAAGVHREQLTVSVIVNVTDDPTPYSRLSPLRHCRRLGKAEVQCVLHQQQLSQPFQSGAKRSGLLTKSTDSAPTRPLPDLLQPAFPYAARRRTTCQERLQAPL